MRHESLYFLFSPVTRIKGVGGATSQALERLLPMATNIDGASMPIVRDLLFHLPVGIVDRRFTCPLVSAPDGVVGTFIVTVDEHQAPKRHSKSPYKVICSNETGDITLVFFHTAGDYLAKSLPAGQKRVISGRVERFDGHLQMPHPDIIAPVSQLAEVQRPEPVYPLTVGVTSRRIGKIVDDAITKLPDLPEWIASEWLMAQKWPGWKAALKTAHHPEVTDDLSAETLARQRLAYDEILANQLHLGMLRRNMQHQAGELIKGTGKLSEVLKKNLPFTLTAGQEQVLKEIDEDMISGRRMGRLLQGDVGSGKTIVATFAMLRAVEQGLQAALMVPTEIIARQHYKTLSALLTPIGVEVVLLTGSVKGKERERVLADIASGKAQLIVGTHALFQEHVEFSNLALAVIDEQHRFGVEQRMALTNKGTMPHVLHMTATPIPRSLTMTLYGDMDISALHEKPAGRQAITTRVIPLSRYGEIMERLKAALDKGEKVYWICPLIEDRSTLEDTDIAAAKSRFTEFKARFGGVVGLVHGKQKAEDRNTEMQKFVEGKTRLLVATTVVEVGVDVPDATIMVIEQAERFGLSQLHQLRGRVGRGDKPSSCVLLYNDKDDGLRMTDHEYLPSVIRPPSSEARLRILRETEDGFKIAEEDLKLRGGGDLLGTRQSGLPRFIFMDIFRHQKLIEQARQDVRQFLTADPDLKSLRGQSLAILLQLFGFQ